MKTYENIKHNGKGKYKVKLRILQYCNTVVYNFSIKVKGQKILK